MYFERHATKCGAEWICRWDQNGDNLRINRAYLQISNYCSVTVRIRVMVRVMISISIGVRLGIWLRIVVYKLLEKVTKCGSVT